MKEDERCDANGIRIKWLATNLFDVARTFLDFFYPVVFLSRGVSLNAVQLYDYSNTAVDV